MACGFGCSCGGRGCAIKFRNFVFLVVVFVGGRVVAETALPFIVTPRGETFLCQETLTELSPAIRAEQASRLNSAKFTPSDFSQTQVGAGITQSQLYPFWAAKEANYVVAGVKRGTSPARILSKIARSRTNLERQLYREKGERNLDPVVQGFGVRRLYDAITSYIPGIEGHDDINQDIWREISAVAMHEAYTSEMSFTEIGGRATRRSRGITHETTSNEKIMNCGVVTFITIEGVPSVIRIYHTAKQIRRLRQDMWERLALARASTDVEVSKIHFANALRAYFIAMPFNRGSSAIGRSFWSGFAKFLYDRTAQIPALTDHYALLMSQPHFEAWVKSWL